MAFTQANITAIETAIIDIATRGTAEVEINGRRVKYSDPLKLRKLLEVMQADVNAETYGGCMDVKSKAVTD